MFVTGVKMQGYLAAALLLLSLLTPPAQAIPVYYDFDFATPGSEISPGIWQATTGGMTVQVSFWSDTNGGLLESGEGVSVSAGSLPSAGVGVCNADEGTAGSPDNCGSDDKIRSMDNAGGATDSVLLIFSQVLELTSFIVHPDAGDKNKAQGLGLSYFTGWVGDASRLEGLSYAELTDPALPGGAGGLGFTQINLSGAKSLNPLLVDVGGSGTEVWGNAILIGASQIDGGDRILLNSMRATVVPLPAAIWLFLSALGALAVRRR